MIDNIQEILGSASIVRVVESCGFELKGRGPVFKIICPFHDDRRPSLQVDSVRNTFRCWVDGTRGDSIDFLQELEKIEWIDAVRKVANICNIPIRESEDKNPEKSRARLDRKKLIKELTAGAAAVRGAAAWVFHQNLMSNPERLDYLLTVRRREESTIKLIGLGGVDNLGEKIADVYAEELGGERPTKNMYLASGIFVEKNGKIVPAAAARDGYQFPQWASDGSCYSISRKAFPDDEREKSDTGYQYSRTANIQLPTGDEIEFITDADKVRPLSRWLNARDLRCRSLIVVEGEHDVFSIQEAFLADRELWSGWGVIGIRGAPSAEQIEELAAIRAGMDTVLFFDADGVDSRGVLKAGAKYTEDIACAILGQCQTLFDKESLSCFSWAQAAAEYVGVSDCKDVDDWLRTLSSEKKSETLKEILCECAVSPLSWAVNRAKFPQHEAKLA